MKLVIPSHFISWKKTPNDAVTPQRQSQFTPKMKANAVPRLLSSLAWIDHYNECNGMTSFMEFMIGADQFCWVNSICILVWTRWTGSDKLRLLGISSHVKCQNGINHNRPNYGITTISNCYYFIIRQLSGLVVYDPWPAAVQVLGSDLGWRTNKFSRLTCHSVTFYFMKKDFERCCDSTTPESIHTRLLSSLVWIDQYNECNGMTSFM